MTVVADSHASAAAVRRDRGPLAVLGVLVVSLAVALAILLVRWPDATAAPADDSAAAGFARDMQVHHAQAVDLSMIVRDRTSDTPTRRLAYDIALTQQGQIGRLAGWLTVWGLRQTGAEPAMAWMGAGHSMAGMNMAMPGMATAADLERLGKESDAVAELDFLRLMIAHHRGGVEMAEAVLNGSDVPVVRDLAQKMVAGQSAEIDLMNDMIATRGGQRV